MTILDTILRTKRDEVAALSTPDARARLRDELAEAPPVRGFAHALRRQAKQGPAVIAEIKRASPSKGIMRDPLDPAWIANRYAAHGAAALSVLTDRHYFRGSRDDLREARAACALPVLRKDFIVDGLQLIEARSWGADAILLIVAALSSSQLNDLEAQARELSLDVLIEVHDENELQRALALRSPLIGINNRDLRSFEVNLDTTERLLPSISSDRFVIAESGIDSPAALRRLYRAGVPGYLIGEACMRADDPGKALADLLRPVEDQSSA